MKCFSYTYVIYVHFLFFLDTTFVVQPLDLQRFKPLSRRADLNLQCKASGIWRVFELVSRAYLQAEQGGASALGRAERQAVGWKRWSMFNVHG